MDLKLLAIGATLLLLLGCLTVPSKFAEGGEAQPTVTAEEMTGVGIEEIVIPEINESEGDFELPV